MKRLLLLTLLLLPATLLAKIPDEEDIKRKTMDSASPYYFTTLMLRYNNLEQLTEEA